MTKRSYGTGQKRFVLPDILIGKLNKELVEYFTENTAVVYVAPSTAEKLQSRKLAGKVLREASNLPLSG